ncbi:hypothetical protein QN277_023512 [Acacia crassicarpa]|uniref:Uncharacterized protein n=1 Tax=Acacia crassicarpa TaxID=499986 RepID=A0AAE1JHB3_9FABA|nr:hypothetical protein QN277_023512 [Acacia crassicarpa]
MQICHQSRRPRDLSFHPLNGNKTGAVGSSEFYLGERGTVYVANRVGWCWGLRRSMGLKGNEKVGIGIFEEMQIWNGQAPWETQFHIGDLQEERAEWDVENELQIWKRRRDVCVSSVNGSRTKNVRGLGWTGDEGKPVETSHA